MNLAGITLTPTPRHNYASGEVVTVDESRLRSLIVKGEETLGLTERRKSLGLRSEDREFSLLYLPDNIIARMGVNAAYSAERNTFAAPREQHEATLFHEVVHYLMYQERLLFGPSLQRASLHDRLIDETVAELAASNVYGYNGSVGDLIGFYEQLKDGSSEALDLLAGQLQGLQRKEIESAVRTMDFSQLAVAKRQRAIEAKYRETRDLGSIKGDVNHLDEFISALSGPFAMISMSEAVRILAVGNAISLRKSEVQPKNLVSWLRDGVAADWSSFALYFYDIIGLGSLLKREG